MALGVLNNLSAIYAENNLNNTNSSLQTVLQQLSSGSKINSGADDAAGLALVNGLQANQSALTQSKTNATEGVGLLQVADGALSQVTSLLDRAITLATEASNGTLNANQEGAANQEYQSILSEVNNIGQTTTYNQQQVFTGQAVAIYTGDSSAAGSSIDELNIRGLSESSMGDTGGKMAYSDGANNVFINLSSTNPVTGVVTNAQNTDSLNISGTTTINVNYLVKGANGTESTATTSITVGTGSLNTATGTTYANTANGLIAAINGAGLGLSATFATQTQAGVTGGGTQTGIEITGGLLSAGVDPSAASTSGVFNAGGIPSAELLTQGQTVTIKVGNQTAAAITINSATSTLTELADAINHPVNAQTQNPMVTASVITNGDGTQSLSLADTANNGGALSVTTGGNNYTSNVLTDGTASAAPVTLSFINNPSNYTMGQTGSDAQATLGISGTNTPTQVLTGQIVLSNNTTPGASPVTFVMGQAQASGSALTGTVNLASSASTLQDLATAIQNNLGVTTTIGTNGITMVSGTTGTTIESIGTPTLAAQVSVQNTVIAATPASGATAGNMTLSLNGDGGTLAATDVLATGTSLVLQNGNVGTPGSATTFVVGANGSTTSSLAAGTITVGSAAAGTVKVSDLVAAIHNNTATLGYDASAAAGIILTANTNGTTFSVSNSSTLADISEGVGAFGNSATGAVAYNAGSQGTATLLTGLATASTNPLTGTVVINNSANNVAQTFVMGGVSSGGAVNNTTTLGNGTSTMNDLVNAITANTSLGITAIADPDVSGKSGGIDLTTKAGNNGAITITSPNANAPLSDSYTLGLAGGVTTVTQGALQYNTATLAPLVGGATIPTNTPGNVSGGALSGTIVITNNSITDTFVMNSLAANGAAAGGNNTINIATASSTLSGLNIAINNWKTGAVDALDLTSSVDATTGGLVLQSSVDVTVGGAMSVGSSSLKDAVAAVATPTGGLALTNAASASVTVGQGKTANSAGGGTMSTGDTLVSGQSLVLHVNGTDKTFTMGTASGNNASQFFTGTGNLKVSDLINTIDNSGLGLQAAVNQANTGLTVNYSDPASAMTLTFTSSNLMDAYQVNVPTGTPGTAGAAAAGASATVGTTGSIGAGDTIGGNIVITNGGSPTTFTMANLGTGNQNMAGLVSAINNNNTLGVVAKFQNGALHLQSTVPGAAMTIDSSALTDTAGEALLGGLPGANATSLPSTTTLTLGSGAISLGDTITGSIALSANGNITTFTMGATAAQVASSTTGNIFIAGTTLTDLESAIDTSNLNVNATQGGSSLTLASRVDNGTTIGVVSNSLNDDFSNLASQASLGSFAKRDDQVSGTISFTLGSGPLAQPEVIPIAQGTTVKQMVDLINNGSYGVKATEIPTGNGTFETVMLTSNTYGTSGQINNTSGTSIVDSTATASLSYIPGHSYDTGLSSGSLSSNTAIYDSSSGQTNSATGLAQIVSNSNGSSSVATISYSDGAGASLTATDLLNQTDAETALNQLNIAITDVAAQDGYIGAQINTLNSISQVMSTQQENVVSAQNAIQATDYASATSNMSKYEILSQTGIAALAQANSVQQEVTKLLQ